MNRDPYTVLGVRPGASAENIKAAFRKLAMIHHPDRPTGNAEKFKEISAAYNLVKDRPAPNAQRPINNPGNIRYTDDWRTEANNRAARAQEFWNVMYDLKDQKLQWKMQDMFNASGPLTAEEAKARAKEILRNKFRGNPPNFN